MRKARHLTILVVCVGGWGRGDTYEEAHENCRKAVGSHAVKEFHVVWTSTDHKIRVDSCGSLVSRASAITQKILRVRNGRAELLKE